MRRGTIRSYGNRVAVRAARTGHGADKSVLFIRPSGGGCEEVGCARATQCSGNHQPGTRGDGGAELTASIQRGRRQRAYVFVRAVRPVHGVHEHCSGASFVGGADECHASAVRCHCDAKVVARRGVVRRVMLRIGRRRVLVVRAGVQRSPATIVGGDHHVALANGARPATTKRGVLLLPRATHVLVQVGHRGVAANHQQVWAVHSHCDRKLAVGVGVRR